MGGDEPMIQRGLLAGWVACGLIAATGCSDERYIRSYEVPKEAEAPAPAGSRETPPPPSGGDLVWELPAGWTENSSPSSMRLASFTVPLENGDPGDCSIVVLSGPAGGVVGNVNRWRGQIGLPAASSERILEEARTEEGRLGEFQVYRLENPESPEQAFWAAILPHGGRTVFVKLAAPAASLDSLEPGFLSLCRSLGASGT
jgi:hypothetical protein